MTEGQEAGNQQFKKRYRNASAKSRRSVNKNYILQIARMELIVRRGRYLRNIATELKTPAAAPVNDKRCVCGRELKEDACAVCDTKLFDRLQLELIQAMRVESPAAALAETAAAASSSESESQRETAAEPTMEDDRNYEYGNEEEEEADDEPAAASSSSAAEPRTSKKRKRDSSTDRLASGVASSQSAMVTSRAVGASKPRQSRRGRSIGAVLAAAAD
jgi:hypothetical protein